MLRRVKPLKSQSPAASAGVSTGALQELTVQGEAVLSPEF